MQQNQFPIKLEKTKYLITPRAGLVLIEKIAKELDLSQLLSYHFGKLKKRKKGLSVWRQILDMVCLLADGGSRIEDLKQLQNDEAWHKLREAQPTMAPRTAIDLLHRFSQEDLNRFEKFHRQLCSRISSKTQLSQISTLDMDATFVEADKQEAKYSYHKQPGFYPMLGFWAELGLAVNGEFRQGNESPGSKALPFLKASLEAVPENKNRKNRLRSDSAWCQADVMDYCQQNQIDFAIGGKRFSNLMEAIETIKPDKWEPFSKDKDELEQHPERADWQIAETLHSFENSSYAYRVVVIRKPYRQLEMFKDIYDYNIVFTNMNWEARRLVKWYWERCTCENSIKELKYGFGLNQFPCSKYLPNGAYFHFVVLAYNLVQALKLIKLGPEWHYLTVKTLRYHLFHVAGLLVRHARQWTLKLYHKFSNFDLFSSILHPSPT